MLNRSIITHYNNKISILYIAVPICNYLSTTLVKYTNYFHYEHILGGR